MKVEKIITIEVTQEMCDELDKLDEKLFAHLSEETKELFFQKREPHKMVLHFLVEKD